MTENTASQHKKQYDWLKPYQWKKGQSGNPTGAKKGKSLKTFVRELLETMPDEEKIEFLKFVAPEMVWRMAEGNPPQKLEGDANNPLIIQIAKEIAEKNDTNTEPKDNSPGQTQV